MGEKVYKCHLTESHQLKAADELIKKLQYKIGEQESYIAELEYAKAPLERALKEKELQLAQLQDNYRVIRAKYKADKEELDAQIRESEIVKSISAERDKWRTLYQSMLKTRDELLSQLIKLRDESNL